jgi:dolichol-phosphate mannosyltransferase
MSGAPTDLTLVVPTFKESDNIVPLVERLDRALAGLAWEVVFVDDDSPDGTADTVRTLAQRDRRVRVIQRIGRRGLASACVEGILSSSAPYVAVMDADLQHDEMLLPQMLQRLKEGGIDLVVASRYVEGGSVAGLVPHRLAISRLAVRLAQTLFGITLQDPMSGFFMMRRAAFDGCVRRLSQQGFKILFDLIACSPRPLTYVELPYSFGTRRHGASKLDALVAWQFGVTILHKLFGRYVPVRFVLFELVGASGIIVHLAALYVLLRARAPFGLAQSGAVLVAMTSNFVLNNLITYRDRSLKGADFVRGLFSFYAVCAIAAVANVGIADWVYAKRPIWWAAGLAGAIVSAVWNYVASRLYTWRETDLP